MNVKALLDDAAAEATAGLRIDVQAAYAQSTQRRAKDRGWAGAVVASALAVAAVVALVAVVLPTGGWLHRSAAVPPGAGSGQVGLPNRWYGLNSWSPSLSRAHIPAASMVLVGASSPMLVSADGRQYARLPWSAGDGQVTLSANGRDVAWVSPQAEGGKPGPVIHRLRLPDGHDHRITLPGGPSEQVVRQVIWADQSLYVVSGDSAVKGGFHTWRLDGTTGAPVSFCACGEFPLGVDGAGRLRQPSPLPGNGTELPGVALTPALSAESLATDDQNASFETPRMIVAPDGTRSASVLISTVSQEKAGGPRILRFALAVDAPGSGPGLPVKRFPVNGPDQITDVRLLGWVPAGLIVRIKSLKSDGPDRNNISIRLIAPDGSSSRVISRSAWRGYEPIAVAAEVVGTAITIPGREPRFSSTDRAHLVFLFRHAWYMFGSRVTAMLLVVLGLSAVLMVSRRRRRKLWKVGVEK